MLLFSYRSCSCLGLWRFGSSYTCSSGKLELEFNVELAVSVTLVVLRVVESLFALPFAGPPSAEVVSLSFCLR